MADGCVGSRPVMKYAKSDTATMGFVIETDMIIGAELTPSLSQLVKVLG